MSKLVWCAINVSEGKNKQCILALQNVCKQTGIFLQHTDVGHSVNRSVFSIFAKQENLIDFALDFYKTAFSFIDMRNHKGSHPRIGAVDVFPIVPLNNSTYIECDQLAVSIAKQVGFTFQLPVFLYENSQPNKFRNRLEQIRKGDYEALEKKLSRPNWQPDYGTSIMNFKTGGTIVGARKPLAAINFSLPYSDVKPAKKIAKQLRSSNTHSPYRLEGVKSIGWKIPEYNTIQVSTNITDINQTPIKQVFDSINLLAKQWQTAVHKTELIGLLPQKALLQSFQNIQEGIDYLLLENELNPNLSQRIFNMKKVYL